MKVERPIGERRPPRAACSDLLAEMAVVADEKVAFETAKKQPESARINQHYLSKSRRYSLNPLLFVATLEVQVR